MESCVQVRNHFLPGLVLSICMKMTSSQIKRFGRCLSGQDAAFSFLSLKKKKEKKVWSVGVLSFLSAYSWFYIYQIQGLAVAPFIAGCARGASAQKRIPLLPPPPRPFSPQPILINNYRQLKDLFIPKGLPFTFLRGSAQGDATIIRLTRDPYFTMSLRASI